MSGERISQAIQRIEAAVDRINRAEQLLGSQSAGDSELVKSHEALREEMSQTLSQLDRLIESIEQ